jgi:hypothetical protein
MTGQGQRRVNNRHAAYRPRLGAQDGSHGRETNAVREFRKPGAGPVGAANCGEQRLLTDMLIRTPTWEQAGGEVSRDDLLSSSARSKSRSGGSSGAKVESAQPAVELARQTVGAQTMDHGVFPVLIGLPGVFVAVLIGVTVPEA